MKKLGPYIPALLAVALAVSTVLCGVYKIITPQLAQTILTALITFFLGLGVQLHINTSIKYKVKDNERT